MNILLLITLIFVGMVLVINVLLPLFWPTRWIYFFSFRHKEQQEHEEMIASIKDHIKRRREFDAKVEKLKQETNVT